MNEASKASIPPPAVTPKKTNPWIIVIIVIVVVCCGCFGIAGLIFGFWDPIKQSLGLSNLLRLLTVMA